MFPTNYPDYEEVEPTTLQIIHTTNYSNYEEMNNSHGCDYECNEESKFKIDLRIFHF